MPFPISASGKVDVSIVNSDTELLATNLTAWLQREMARDIHRDGNLIRFRAPSLLDGNTCYPIPSVDGVIEITSSAVNLPIVNYKIRFLKSMALSSLMVFGFFGPLFYFNREISLYQQVFALSVIWSWMIGGGYLFSVLRFPSLIKIAASGREREWYE